MKLDKLMLKDLRGNIVRGFKLIKMLNFDSGRKTGPVRLEITASSACNFKCCFCDSHSYLRDSSVPSIIMDDATLHDIIRDVKKLKTRELLFSGNGEPLLCKGLAKEIKENGRYFKIEILTNGSSLELVDEELMNNLAALTISLNSGNGASHRVTHGYQGENMFPQIIANLDRILKYPRASDKIKLNYVITTDNIDELDDFFKLAMERDVLFMARPVAVDFKELKPKELSEEQLRGILEKAERYLGQKLSAKISLSFQLMSRAGKLSLAGLSGAAEKSGPRLRPCYMSFIQPYIAANGDVLLCCDGAEKPLGNISEGGFLGVWQDKEKTAARLACTQMHLTGKAPFKICAGCANVLYHSATFHGIYSKIPLLPGRLTAKSKK